MRVAAVLAPALALSVLLSAASGGAQTPAPAAPSASVLVGTWKVDLRPTPSAAPYFQELVVTKVNASNNTFEGSFYGAPVTQARIDVTWGAVRIAFVTADGSGPYNHSAVLHGGRLEGLTNSTGRAFLSYWSAVKQ